MLISERFAEILLHFLFDGFSAEIQWLYRTNGCEVSKFYSIFFVRLGLKIISGDFEEDLTKIVGGVGFQRFFDKTGNNRISIQPKIGAIERRIRLYPRNPMVPHFF